MKFSEKAYIKLELLGVEISRFDSICEITKTNKTIVFIRCDFFVLLYKWTKVLLKRAWCWDLIKRLRERYKIRIEPVMEVGLEVKSEIMNV